jgi:RNA polymerase sigma factor (sigma-70 family)
VSAERSEELLALDDALGRLDEQEPRLARIVECRCFGGLTVDETAEALAVSPATVKRGWSVARAWLYRELQVGAP